MKICPNCGTQNRDQANFCRQCRTALPSSIAPAPPANNQPVQTQSQTNAQVYTKPQPQSQVQTAGQTMGSTEYIAKDNIAELFHNFEDTCAFAQDFTARVGKRPELDCIIIGDAGTGKRYMAEKLCAILCKYKISSSAKPTKVVDAADWDDYVEELDDNLKKISKGCLLVTNCQNLTGDANSSSLDKLFARMRSNTGNMPVVILCGLTAGFGNYISKNSNVASLFEFHFHLEPFKDKHLSLHCKSILSNDYKTQISTDADRKIDLVLKKMFRDGMSGSNGHLSKQKADECLTKLLKRRGQILEEQDVTGEPFEELTEEQILAKLDAFVGLADVKKEIHALIQNIKRHKITHPDKAFRLETHYVFTGSPGTGKTTIARLFADILNCLQVLPSGHLVEVSRKELVSQYVGETALKTEAVINKAMGGVLFIDEAYSIKKDENDSFGQEAIDTLLKALEDRKGEFVCIIAGYTNEMIAFLRTNSGLESRFKAKINFADYNGKELTTIFRNLLNKKGNQFTLDEESDSKVEKFFDRMYQSRTDTFGNARAVRNAYDDAIKRLGVRTQYMDPNDPNYSVLVWSDIVGEKESEDISVEGVMKELDEFVGMQSVKDEVRKLAEEMRFQQMRMEFGGKASIRPVNIILTGNPGTGKTTVARVLGRLFKAMGICSTDRVIERSRKDIIGQYANESDKNMDKAVNEAMGGVLFLDEAYTLAPFDDMGQCNDSEGLKALERLMVRMENDRGKFVLVCAGYKDKMGNLMKANEGFQSRFTHQINIEDYEPSELTEIFRRNAEKEGYIFGEGALDRALSAFKQIKAAKSGKSFGNAREARNMLNNVQAAMGTRISKLPDDQFTKEVFFTILPEDIPYEEPKIVTEEECMAELNELIGLGSVKEEIKAMLDSIKNAKFEAEAEGNDFKGFVPPHYLFLGNPGTGKTTLARLMGNILCSMGVLPRPDVYECNRSDLVAGYLGQTAPKTREAVDRAMGAILFIDEAYSLNQGGNDSFGNECINELVPLLENRRGKFVCIAAGYTREMQAFLDANSGMKSRFKKVINFEDYTGEELTQIFKSLAKKGGYTIDPEAEKAIAERFDDMYVNRNFDFGNARVARNFFDEVKSNLSRRCMAKLEELVNSGIDRASAYKQVQPKLIIKEDIQ